MTTRVKKMSHAAHLAPPSPLFGRLCDASPSMVPWAELTACTGLSDAEVRAACEAMRAAPRFERPGNALVLSDEGAVLKLAEKTR